MTNLIRNQYFVTTAFITIFMLFLNLVFPLISDDFCHLLSPGNFDAVIHSYMTWNARVGELLSIFFTGLNGTSFAIVNTLIFAVILSTIFPLLFARQGTTKDDSLFILSFFTLLSLFTTFGAVFLWRAGAMNYAWSLAFCLLHFVVYRYYYAGITGWYERSNLLVVVIFCILSFMAGMSSFDLGALGCLIHLSILTYRKITHQPSKLRFIIPVFFYMLGFFVLYTAPGTSVRSQGFDEYVSLGQLITWLYTLELNTLASHYLDALGKSMNRTNYFIALASIACTYIVFKYQSEHRFMPISFLQWVLGYLGTLSLLTVLLFSNELPPSGEALGATILFSNFIVSVIALAFIIKSNSNVENKSIVSMLIFLHCILIVDVSAYSVGVIPTRRAYFTACVLCALILSTFVNLLWSSKVKKIVFIPLFVWVLFLTSIQTIGLRVTNNALVMEPLSALSNEDDLIIDNDYKMLKSKNFYDWGMLSSEESNFANNCFSQYYGINSTIQYSPTQYVSIIEYIEYLMTLKK
ncbi:DUF6056 family protein [Vibrio alfacsensis]|uniref:DUF6056 family protein n=1 Tax=Vibrio alfacsensis TaxID=1074311 RepID=UPI001BF017EC|nr:DUF6056 family protein [Vibrio alfacsensis]BCN22968.1 hypothetical protein VYA_01600 [Vibrio alfacsensis]